LIEIIPVSTFQASARERVFLNLFNEQCDGVSAWCRDAEASPKRKGPGCMERDYYRHFAIELLVNSIHLITSSKNNQLNCGIENNLAALRRKSGCGSRVLSLGRVGTPAARNAMVSPKCCS
jgi:hypothetical protein